MAGLGRNRGQARSSFSGRGPLLAYISSKPRLVFTGQATIEAGNQQILTLLVRDNPATRPYNGFALDDDAGTGTTYDGVDELTIPNTVPIGTYALKVRATSSGGRPDLSDTITIIERDSTAPVLILPTGTQTGATTATLGVTTNEGSSPDSANGTLYAVASTSATPPSAAQIIAGHDSTGGAAAYAANQAVATTGAKTFSATGLVASTTYYAYFVQKDFAGNTSSVAASASFTTAGSEQAETTAWVNAVVGDGGTVSGGRRTLVNSLIAGLKADGVWSKLDQLPIYAAENTQSALRELKAAAAHTNHSATFTTDRGYNGGGTGYIDTGFNASTAGGVMTQNSAHISAWVLEARTVSHDYDAIGVFDGVNTISAINPYISGQQGVAVTAPLAGQITTNVASAQGMGVANRSGANAEQAYLNGSAIGSDNVNGSLALVNLNFFVCGRNQGGSLASGSGDTIAMASLGGSLSAGDVSNFYSRMTTYLTAVGAI